MASCFKKPNEKYLSAKDYTIKKRRTTLFCNLRQNALNNINQGLVPLVTLGNNEACIDKNGIFFKYRDHKSQLDMLAAFEDFRTDLLEAVQGQLFNDNFCPPYYISLTNTNIKNNYDYNNVQLAYGDGTGYGHLTDYFGALNEGIVSVSSNPYKNKYAEIKSVTPSLGGALLGGFQNHKFFLEKPPICDNNTRPQVLKNGDIPAPQLGAINILIEDDGINPPELQGVNLQIN